jgi:uncharacterized glyoxalase superfamily protein PhnB
MIDTIGGIVVIVSDQQKAMEFYSQKLGKEIQGRLSKIEEDTHNIIRKNEEQKSDDLKKPVGKKRGAI